MKKFISYKESQELIRKINISNLQTQKVFLTDSLNRILAQDIVAKENSPAYETSAMDGYAFKYSDISKGKLKIIDKNPAGSVVETEVLSNTCIKTFTGSLMPKGSDTLIPIENVTVIDDEIIINEEVKKGFAVRQVGENYKINDLLISKGTKIDFAQIGVMAALNISQIEVFQKVKVTVASTGSEILDIGDIQTNRSQIRSSNHFTMQAIATKYGAEVIQKGVVKDDKEAIKELLSNGLSTSDIVVTTGGVSVGDYDFVKDIIKNELGCELIFQGVNIKPGQHILIARKDNKFVVGLPGFAYSSTVTFLLYVVPLIAKLSSTIPIELNQIVEAIMDEDYTKFGKKSSFISANLKYKDGNYFVDFEGKKEGSSAILTNMLGNSVLLYLEEEETKLSKGDKVKVILY